MEMSDQEWRARQIDRINDNNWIKEIMTSIGHSGPGADPSTLKIGDVVLHPDGRTVKIVSGQYWGTYGLSNFWCWQEVMTEGLGQKEYGYWK